MTERLWLSAALVLTGTCLFLVTRGVHLWNVRRRLGGRVPGNVPGLTAFRAGQPAVLYFSAEHCAPCRTIVKPALQRLVAELGNRFQVLEIDAELQPEAVRYWQVLSLPTVFVLDPQGKPQRVHYGIVSKEALRAELSAWL